MCGIFGYIGKKSPVSICLDGLKRLEYRGYDSAGVAGLSGNSLQMIKSKGKLDALQHLIENAQPEYSLAIAHTRWATHGEPSIINAHPHTDSEESLAIVHNGIIENFQELQKELTQSGIECSTDTDSEIIAHLIAHAYSGNLREAVQNALQRLEGAFALAIIHKDHPGHIIAAARHSPLVLAQDSEGEIYLSSDPNAFIGENLNLTFLQQNEIADIQEDTLAFFHLDGTPLTKESAQFTFTNTEISKGHFEHFMLKEIYEQPSSIARAMEGRLNEEYGTAIFPELNFSSKELQEVSRILILGCGTSWHAGCLGVSLFEGLSRIPAECEIASEYRYTNPIITPDTLVIAISQSGETADTIAALREIKAKGAKTIALCNVEHSTLARETDACILLKAGPEVSVCSTKAFSNQVIVISLLALYFARIHHMGKVYGQRVISELKRLPIQIEEVLSRAHEIEALAKEYAQFDRYFFLGRRFMYPTSLEAALKLKEISYLDATGYPAGELKHGPIALIDESIAVIGLCGNKQTFDKMFSNLQEVKARGGKLIVFAPEHRIEQLSLADHAFILPDNQDHATPILYSVATQLFAYYIAKERQTDIDQPRNLAKSVTVE